MSDKTPQERVEYYVRRQAEQRRAAGDTVDADALRRHTAKLLEMADAETRRGGPTVSRRPEKDPAEVLEAKRKLGPEAMAEASGTEYFYRDEKVEPLISPPKPQLRVPGGIEGEKHHALIKRIRLLMKRIPGYRLKPGESIYAGHVYPRFAQILDMNTRYAALTDPESHGLGKYEGLSLADRHRCYYRVLEDLCAASDAVIGIGWWVPR